MFQFHYSHLSKIIMCPFEAEIVEEGKKKTDLVIVWLAFVQTQEFYFDWNLQSDCRFLMLMFIFYIIASAIYFILGYLFIFIFVCLLNRLAAVG